MICDSLQVKYSFLSRRMNICFTKELGLLCRHVFGFDSRRHRPLKTAWGDSASHHVCHSAGSRQSTSSSGLEVSPSGSHNSGRNEMNFQIWRQRSQNDSCIQSRWFFPVQVLSLCMFSIFEMFQKWQWHKISLSHPRPKSTRLHKKYQVHCNRNHQLFPVIAMHTINTAKWPPTLFTVNIVIIWYHQY